MNLLKSLFQRVRFGVNTLLSLAKFNELANVNQSDVLLLCHDANRGYTFCGKKYAQLLDSINDRLLEHGITSVTLATPLSIIASDAAYGNVFTANRHLLKGIIRDKIFRRIQKDESINRGRLKAWGKLLDHIRPKVVIGIQPTPEMCMAARDRNIFIADLQHGLVYDKDENGYYGYGHRRKYNQGGWPDCILCWDRASAEHIKSQSPASVAPRVIGNPWFLRFLYPRESDSLLPDLFSRQTISKSKPVILITLQWELKRFIDVHPTGLPLSLIEVIRNHGEDYIWWLRLHPVQMQEPMRTEIESMLEDEFSGYANVFWRDCSAAPLPVVLSQTTLHLTAYSAVTVEASWFNIPSGLLDDRHDLLKAWFSVEISQGCAEIIKSTPEAIQKWLHDKSADRALRSPRKNYISSDSLDEFISEISESVRHLAIQSKSNENAIST